MRMNRKAALVASVGMLGVAACSDSPTAPVQASAVVPKSTFAVGAVTPTPAPTAATGKVIVCKTGNAGGSFTFTRTTEGPNIVASSFVGAGPIVIAVNTCLEVANDDSPSGSGSHITVTEAPAANTVQTITACQFRGYQLDGVTLNPPENCTYVNGGDLFLNHFHGYVVTYNNVFTPPPPPRCTYTKGWYQSKHATDGEDRDIIAGVEGLSVADQSKIFNATNGKLGDVEVDGPNNLLNLYQQLLAALNNLNNNEDGGPNAVDAAIDAAQDGTSITAGLTISTTLTSDEIGDLIDTLSAFNEGAFEGFAHCDD